MDSMNNKFTIFDILDLGITIVTAGGAAILVVTLIHFFVPEIF